MLWTRRAATGGLVAAILPLHAEAATVRPGSGPMALEAAEGRLRLQKAPAAETAVWAYNGQVPGPLIRVKRGEEVRVRLVNKLAQPTSLVWHGVRNANAMDGVAGLTQAPVQPGETFDYRFTPPDAGFYWYHPHVVPFSAEQLGRGLYGLLVVDEPEPMPVDQDVLIVVADWTLDAKGQIVGGFLDKATASAQGRIGSLVTLNSVPIPAAPITLHPGARVRLRILNACAARIPIITLAGMAASVVAIDGQPSELFPLAGGTLPIGPGSRFEIIADMPVEAGKAPALILREQGGPDRPLMTFAIEGKSSSPHTPVTKLAPNPLLPTRIPLEKSLKRDLVIGAASMAPKAAAKPTDKQWLWTLDGIGSDGFSGKPLFRVKRGGAVTLSFVNKTKFVQQMHVHGHVFRVLHDLDDGWDPYWRESILVAPSKTKHVAFIADNPGKWSVESLVLDRQVTGLAGWFEVF